MNSVCVDKVLNYEYLKQLANRCHAVPLMASVRQGR